MSTLLTSVVVTFLLSLVGNAIRFKLNIQNNRLFFVILCFAFIEFYSLFYGDFYSEWIILFFISASAFFFKIKGGLIGGFLGWLLYCWHNQVWTLGYLPIFMTIGAISGIAITHFYNQALEQNRWNTQLLKQAKQLNVVTEISLAMRQTMKINKLLKIILISLTDAHGLGFNRAMILLKPKEQQALVGKMAVGPLNEEDGLRNWEKIAVNKYKLTDIIALKSTDDLSDFDLNERVQSLVIPLDEDNVFTEVMYGQTPIHIKTINPYDESQRTLAEQFAMNEFAMIPLVHHGTQLGVLLVDNIINKQPISNEKIESVIPLANQAAIAIVQANLYDKIEEKAIKDGLTGLLNQRAFSTLVERHFSRSQPLSLVIFDIDSFKNYNDTNGHLQGNELLVQLANVLLSSIRLEDLAFRYGGEEFVVLFPNTPLIDALQIAERIRQNIEQTNFPYAHTQPLGKLTVSVGVSSTEMDWVTDDKELLEAADRAMYSAKGLGKNRVVCYSEVAVHE